MASAGPIASPSGFILQPVSDASTEWTNRRTVREQRAQGGQSLQLLQTRMSALVRLRSPTCFMAPSAYPRDIHASSEFTDSLTLDATLAW